ncbi:MAG: DivIVA domain-containing protein, partial [Elusimicrobia bacterium]|nr:DivIVA domain-containing protein [Elusimicrobiota bacterium]
MSINSESIQKKEFHVVFKGYKPEEVDSFLDILAVEFERLQRAYRELKNNVERLKYEGNKESTEMKKVIQEALVSAHRIAEDIKKKAEKEAEEIVKTKVIEEEESYKKLLRNKLQLEKEIEDLGKEYEGFKGKISKLVDDFKEAASRLEENKFLNISRTGKEDINIEESGMKEDSSGESKEEKELIYSGEDESETPRSTEGVIEEEVTEEEDSEKIEFEPFKGKEETEGKELRESGFEDI